MCLILIDGAFHNTLVIHLIPCKSEDTYEQTISDKKELRTQYTHITGKVDLSQPQKELKEFQNAP